MHRKPICNANPSFSAGRRRLHHLPFSQRERERRLDLEAAQFAR
jgi:hypothetical protein